MKLRIVTDAPNLDAGTYTVTQLTTERCRQLIREHSDSSTLESQIRFAVTAKVIGQMADVRLNAHAVPTAAVVGPNRLESVLHVRLAASSTKESRRDGMSAADFEFLLIVRQINNDEEPIPL